MQATLRQRSGTQEAPFSSWNQIGNLLQLVPKSGPDQDHCYIIKKKSPIMYLLSRLLFKLPKEGGGALLKRFYADEKKVVYVGDKFDGMAEVEIKFRH